MSNPNRMRYHSQQAIRKLEAVADRELSFMKRLSRVHDRVCTEEPFNDRQARRQSLLKRGLDESVQIIQALNDAIAVAAPHLAALEAYHTAQFIRSNLPSDPLVTRKARAAARESRRPN